MNKDKKGGSVYGKKWSVEPLSIPYFGILLSIHRLLPLFSYCWSSTKRPAVFGKKVKKYFRSYFVKLIHTKLKMSISSLIWCLEILKIYVHKYFIFRSGNCTSFLRRSTMREWWVVKNLKRKWKKNRISPTYFSVDL